MTDRCERILLHLLKDALHGEKTDQVMISSLSKEDIYRLSDLAFIHYLRPLVYDQLGKDTLLRTMPEKDAEKMIRHWKISAVLQAKKSAEFLSLYSEMKAAGLLPIVVKGIAVRQLYPKPELRPSQDEDLLIEPAMFQELDAFLLQKGFHRLENDLEGVPYEVGYRNAKNGLYLEVHTALFRPEHKVFGKYNDLFNDAFHQAEMDADLQIRVLRPEDHLLYVILHAVKHFMFSGVGIRQLCDIAVFSEKKDDDIDFACLYEKLAQVSAEGIAEKFFAICTVWLGYHGKGENHTMSEKELEPLLKDILSGGVYGQADELRQHSAQITTSTSTGTGILHSFFPGYGYMKTRYPQLQKLPVLLPAAYVHRGFAYIRKNGLSRQPLKIGIDRQKLINRAVKKTVRKVDTADYMDLVLAALQEGKEIAVPVSGSSMVPFLVDGRDRVMVHPLDRALKVGDIILYRRDTGRYVLHRIVGVHDGKYMLAGDNETVKERDIRKDQILGYVSKAERKGQWIDDKDLLWRVFSDGWSRIVPLHSILIKLYAGVHKGGNR